MRKNVMHIKMKVKNGKKVTYIAMAAMIVASILAVIAPQAFGYFRPVPIPQGEEGIYYLSPPNASVPGPGNTTEVQVHANSSMKIGGGKFTIEYDPRCVNITGFKQNTTNWNILGGQGWINVAPNRKQFWATYANMVDLPPADYHVGNITLECVSSTCCVSNLSFVYETYLSNITSDYDVNEPYPYKAGTFTCGAPVEETYSKTLYKGWNLVSLPLTPSDNSTSSVLASVWDNVSAVYRYNATSKQFERASTMDPGTGYFVYVTQNCTWTYSGTPYTSMSIELKKGLNMVGWLNCSKDITDALSSIAGDYWYVARWNAIERKFEVYNPVAPPVFNDFTTMERGEGYFISMKSAGTLTESC